MANPFLDILARIASLEARMAGLFRHAPVAEINAEEQWVRLDLGEGDDGPLLSPKIPYAQIAGALKVHTPPSVGQNMTMFSPTGDPRQAVALPMTWSDQNVSPSQSPDEHVLTFGSVKVWVRSDHIRIEIGGVAWKLSGEGFAQAGGKMGHDALDVGSTHKHRDVTPGPGNTGIPNPDGPVP